jgi:hypothetical protein
LNNGPVPAAFHQPIGRVPRIRHRAGGEQVAVGVEAGARAIDLGQPVGGVV